jgi:DNA-binding CsgD family transcriptional regulator
MNGHRFDQLTQSLARRLRHDGSAERGLSVRPAGQPAPRAGPGAPPASGTCPYQDLATMEPGGQDAAAAICGWEDLRVAPGSGARPSNPSGRVAQAQPLSPREQEVAALIGQGLKNREIARALVVSERTVHAHVRTVLDKLGLASRAQVAVWAIEHRLPQRTPPGAHAEDAATRNQGMPNRAQSE